MPKGEMIAITDREARALREDSLSGVGDCAVRRLRPQPSRVYGPYRTRFRLGQGERRRRCRACLSHINDRDPVVVFKIRSAGAWEPIVAMIHQKCPEVESPNGSQAD